MNNKAVLLRSVSALATAAASTAGTIPHASAQVLEQGANGYYYSVTGGLLFTPSETVLSGVEDKLGVSGSGESFGTSGFTSASGGSSYSSFTFFSSFWDTNSSGFDDYKGLFASVSFGKQLDPTWDVRGTLSMGGAKSSGWAAGWNEYSSFTFFSSNNGNGSGYTGSSWTDGYDSAWAEGQHSFGFAAADFEVGYTPVLSDTFSVRLFAGIRALKFQSTFKGQMGGSGWYEANYNSDNFPGTGFYSSYYSSYYENFFDGTMKAEFTGIGPRIGAQMATRFEGTNFGLSGSVGASVLFGKQKVTMSGYSEQYSQWYSSFNSLTDSGSSASNVASGSSFTSGISSASWEGNKTVLDLQASIGIDYYLNDSTALTVGYQAEKFMEIDGDDNGPGTNIDVLTHGAFVKLGGTF